MTTGAVHYHRCKECRERMEHGCIDGSCAEGFQWVILCLRCYERMQWQLSETAA